LVKQLTFDFVAPAAPTLDLFVAGRNAELVERLRALAVPGGERFIYLWGSTGSGRTHLLESALALLRAATRTTRYVGCGPQSAFSEALLDADALAVDDVDRLDEAGQIALFNMYNALRERGKTLLAAGNAPPVQLALRPDLVTRLSWGLVYQVHALTDAEKAEALAHHAAARGFSLQPEVRQYLLTHVRRDMATLLAMLDALDRYSLEAKRAVTVPLVRELLSAAPADK
jgi:DnaA family protein